jgi:hypothetical protein
MRTLYDSTTADDIPTTVEVVAGYVDGRYAWSAADWARFPGAVKVRIAVRASTNDGHVLDVEPGDATPVEAPGWVAMRRRAGVDPTVYCNLSDLPTVRAAFDAAGVAQPHYWVARYDGVADIPAGCIAKQYMNDPGSGGHWDLSAVADYWPGVDPAPVSLSSSSTISEEDYAMIRIPKGGAEGGPDKAVNYQLAVSMLREHDVIIAPGDKPVVLYASYHWAWDKGTGGNPVPDRNKPVVVPVQGSYSYIVPRGTGKVDLLFWSDDDFTVHTAPR